MHIAKMYVNVKHEIRHTKPSHQVSRGVCLPSVVYTVKTMNVGPAGISGPLSPTQPSGVCSTCAN